MSISKLIKLAPMIIMIAFLAYAGYSMQSSATDLDGDQSGLAKELDAVVQDILAVGDAIKAGTSDALRDPFQVSERPVLAGGAAAAKDGSEPDSESDPNAEIVRGLSLDATFVQGHDQMAIIGGRLYSKGQHLLLDSGGGKTDSKLYVVNVLPAKVILHADGTNYVLTYSDRLGSKEDRGRPGSEDPQQAMAEIDAGGQLAMFQKLLNSPLGALGKRMVGDPAQNSSAARSKRSRRPRGSASSSTSP
jgi:hypothetical protein